MSSSTGIRWGGLAAVLGGLLWLANTVVVARMPEGCIGDECYLPGRSMRHSGDAGELFIAAAALIALGVAAVVVRAHRAGRFGRLGRAGLYAVSAGFATVMAAGLTQELFFNGDFPLMPYFVIPGGLALVVGFLLLGIAILRAGVLPRWTAALLIVGTLAMLGFNDQNEQVLMAIPFGIAWVGAGYALWTGKAEPQVAVHRHGYGSARVEV